MTRPTVQPKQQANTPHLQQHTERVVQALGSAPLAVVRGASVNFGSS